MKSPNNIRRCCDCGGTEDAQVHGVVANVSPMKNGLCSYFQAVVTGGAKNLKVVRFNHLLRKRLAYSESTMEAVALSNC